MNLEWECSVTKEITKTRPITVEISADDPKHCSIRCQFFNDSEYGVSCILYMQELKWTDEIYRLQACINEFNDA